jgi:hypothetical protein
MLHEAGRFIRSAGAGSRVLLNGMNKIIAACLAVTMVATSPGFAIAQSSGELAPGAPSWCRACTPPPPFVPPIDPPGDPDDPPPPGGPDDPSPPSGRRGWAAIGAAGLALAAGIPLGAALQPTMPFRPVVADAGTPSTPAGATPTADLARGGDPVIPGDAPGITQQEAPGVLAPDTASHLPLLLAIGIAAIAGGVALLRDQRRRRRRSMRAHY